MRTIITHKRNDPDTDTSYIFIHLFASGVSYAGIPPYSPDPEDLIFYYFVILI